MSAVLRRRLDLRQYQEAQESLRQFPAEIVAPPLSCWAAAVETLTATKLYQDRRLAIKQYRTDAEQAFAYAGIAFGLRLRNSEQQGASTRSLVSTEPPVEELGQTEATLKQVQSLVDQGSPLPAISLLANAYRRRSANLGFAMLSTVEPEPGRNGGQSRPQDPLMRTPPQGCSRNCGFRWRRLI